MGLKGSFENCSHRCGFDYIPTSRKVGDVFDFALVIAGYLETLSSFHPMAPSS
jgi:uncharacterized membrane protein